MLGSGQVVRRAALLSRAETQRIRATYNRSIGNDVPNIPGHSAFQVGAEF